MSALFLSSAFTIFILARTPASPTRQVSTRFEPAFLNFFVFPDHLLGLFLLLFSLGSLVFRLDHRFMQSAFSSGRLRLGFLASRRCASLNRDLAYHGRGRRRGRNGGLRSDR